MKREFLENYESPFELFRKDAVFDDNSSENLFSYGADEEVDLTKTIGNFFEMISNRIFYNTRKASFVIRNDFNSKDVHLIVDGISIPNNIAVDAKATSSGRLKLFHNQIMKYLIFQTKKGILKKGFYPEVFFSVYKYNVKRPEVEFRQSGRLEDVVVALSQKIDYNINIPLRMLMELFLVPYYVFAKKGFSEEEVGEMILDPLSLNGRYEIFQTVKKKLSEKSIYWYPLIHGRSGSKGKLYEPYVAINPSLITGLFEFPLKRIGKTFADSGFSFERKIFPEKAGIKFRGEIYPITPFPILSIKDNFPKEEFASQICSHIEREFFPGSCIREFGIPKETNVDDDIPF